MSAGNSSSLPNPSARSSPQDDKALPNRNAAAMPLSTLLDQIIERFEAAEGDGVQACVRLLDRAGRRLLPGASRRLPSSYLDAVATVDIGPMAGSCGAA